MNKDRDRATRPGGVIEDLEIGARASCAPLAAGPGKGHPPLHAAAHVLQPRDKREDAATPLVGARRHRRRARRARHAGARRWTTRVTAQVSAAADPETRATLHRPRATIVAPPRRRVRGCCRSTHLWPWCSPAAAVVSD